jgi:hypothetical protein
MRTLLRRLAMIGCVVWRVADAQPQARVAVSAFDGAPRLAQAGRAAVLLALGDATIVPAKQWDDALARAEGHGPERWQCASSDAHVDAVIEGWVQAEGGRTRLTVAIRNARTGAEMRTLSLAMDDGGVPVAQARTLASQLREILGAIEDRDRDPTPPASEAADDELLDPHVVERIAVRREPPPRFELGGGAYVAARSMAFGHAGDEVASLPSYPGHTATGIAVHAAAYPLTREDGRGLAGPGLTLDLRKSLTSNEATGGYALSELAWEVGVHYRIAVAPATIDVELDAGDLSNTLVDRPASIAIPNASYSYLGGGARVDLAATDALAVGAGARYMHVLGVGEMGGTDWYGAGLASGVALEGRGAISINRRFVVEAVTTYRRIALRFDGSGEVTQMTGRIDVIDSTLSGAVNLHVRF